MKVHFSKGLYATGLVAFTLQLLVYLFKYVVNSISLPVYLVDNWAGVLGYSMLLVLFIVKRTMNTDIILTVISLLLWIAQFIIVFSANDPLLSFVTSGLGILGVIVSAFALALEIKASDKSEKDK